MVLQKKGREKKRIITKSTETSSDGKKQRDFEKTFEIFYGWPLI